MGTRESNDQFQWYEMMEKAEAAKEQCCDCKFYKSNPDDAGPNCRRFPPIRVDEFKSRFPRTFSTHWCGEFKAKETPCTPN